MTLADAATPPLEDPTYVPEHPPVDGKIPPVVEKWGAASQLRWFDRFWDDLDPQPRSVWLRFYCSTVAHKGGCCNSCVEDSTMGYEDGDGGYCCCRELAARARSTS